MPRPAVDLPQAATEHIPTQVQDKLPDHLQDNFTPPFTGNIIWDNPSILEGHLGTTGEQDVFVFDVAAAIELGSGVIVDGVDNFEVDLDVIAFINVPSGSETEVFFGATIAPPRFPPETILNGASPESIASVFGDEWAFRVWVFDTPSDPYASFAADETVTLQNGDIITLGVAPDWSL